MTTARILASQGLRSFSAIEQSMGDLTYGTAGLAEILQAGSGMANSISNTLPLFGMIFAATDILKALEESWYAPKGMTITANAQVHTKSLIRILTSGTLGYFGYEGLSQTMSLGSTAFCSLCDGVAIKAAGDFTLALIDFVQAYRKYNRAKQDEAATTSSPSSPALLLNNDNILLAFNNYNPNDSESESDDTQVEHILNLKYKDEDEYEKAKKKLIFNTLNFLGWGLLALTKTASLAALAPYLLVIGALCLVTAGLYAMKKAYDNYSFCYETSNSETTNRKPSRLSALECLFSEPAYGTGGENTPLSEVTDLLLVVKN